MVASLPWTATSSDEVVSREASLPEAEVERWSLAIRFRLPDKGVARAPEEVSSRGPCSRFHQDHSHPNGDGQSWTRRRRGKGHVETALTRAQQLAAITPLDKRIADAEAFIARAQKRVAAEAAKILEAEKQKQLFEEELALAEKDLECFRREAETLQVSTTTNPSRPRLSVESRARTSPCGAGSVEGRWCRPRCTMWAERELVLPHGGGSWGDSSHANVRASRVELDLHDALLKGDNNRALELSTKLSEGAERMIEMTGGMVS